VISWLEPQSSIKLNTRPLTLKTRAHMRIALLVPNIWAWSKLVLHLWAVAVCTMLHRSCGLVHGHGGLVLWPFAGWIEVIDLDCKFSQTGLLCMTGDTKKVLCWAWSRCVELWCDPICNVVWDLAIWRWEHIEPVPENHGTFSKFSIDV
jgi:hypothetical protein